MLKFNYSGKMSNTHYEALYYIHTYQLATDPTALRSVRDTHSCREFFVKSYRDAITGTKDPQTIRARKANALLTLGMPFSSMYDSWNTRLKETSEKSLYIVNSFEKEHKWPLTKLYLVKCENQKVPMVFFSGPRKWTMSPYLMSIWALGIRLGKNNWMPKKLLTLDHENLVRQLVIAANSNSGSGDANQVLCTIREWDPFMTLYPDLFSGETRRYHWSKKHLNGKNDRPEGIRKLIDGTTGYKKLREKYFELKEAKKLK